MNFATIHHYLRLLPFDTRTEEGRNNERYRLAAISILANIVSRAIGIAVMFLSVSLTMPYLGAERFGVWMTIASFAGLLTFLDFGVGNALTNHVAYRAAADKASMLSQTISGGLAFLALIGAGMALLLWLIAANLPWKILVKVTRPELLLETRQAAMCFALLFGLNIFTSGVQRIFSGLQQAYFGHLAAALGYLVSCIGLWLAAGAQQGIPVLLIVVLGSQSVASLPLLGLLIFRKLFRLDNIFNAARHEFRYLFKAGGLFFLLQIGTMVGWGADSLIIASSLGATQVATFAIVQRLFQLVSQPMSIMNAPLWSAYADANSRSDKVFIKKTLIRSISITGIYSVVAFLVLLFFGELLVKAWAGNVVNLNFMFLAAYGAWAVIDAVSNAFSMFMNGCNVVRPQVIGVFSLIFVSIPVKIVFINYYGLTGMLTGFVIVYCANIALWYGFVFRQDIKSKI